MYINRDSAQNGILQRYGRKKEKGKERKEENILPWSHKDHKEDEWAYVREREREGSGWRKK